jgi:hypothetical protein
MELSGLPPFATYISFISLGGVGELPPPELHPIKKVVAHVKITNNDKNVLLAFILNLLRFF